MKEKGRKSTINIVSNYQHNALSYQVMMQNFSIINLLIAYGTIQAFFIAFTLVRSDTRSLFRLFFAALLIIEGIILFERLLVETELIQSVPHFLGIAYPISFLKPTLILLMAHSITVQRFTFTPKWYLHFIPFALMLCVNIPFFLLGGVEKLEVVRTFMEKIPSYKSVEFYMNLCFFSYISIYILYALKKLNHVRLHVRNNELVNWYRIVLILYAGFLVIHLIYFLIQPAFGYNFALFNQLSMLIMTFIIQSIAFKLMDRSALFTSSPPDLSNLERRKIHVERIAQKLEKEKMYLDETLNLQAFATSVELPSSYVSELINQNFNRSFKKLVNEYRVKEAKAIMATATSEKPKLIEVAYQSGFNNKVSFYRAFKEIEGMAPSEYLNKLIEQPHP